jgi:DNA-binding IclR family transcriptional regulator
LQEVTQETAYLSLWDGREIFIAAIAESPRSVRVKALTIGSSEANHASALGKAILAYLDTTESDHYLANRALPAYTPKTLIDPTLIKSYLLNVRQQGYSLDEEEFLPDVCCIGAPIFDACQQVIASIAISLPATRYHMPGDNLISAVRHAAQAAARTLAILGYVRPTPAQPGR